jgi:hypothetical protein
MRDDPLNPACPISPRDPLCDAIELTSFGLDYRYAVGRRLQLSGEWLRSAYRSDARGDSLDLVWDNAYRVTADLTLLPRHLRLETAYLHLGADHASPYSAVTYQANRKGQRHRVVASYGGLELDAFLRWLEPVEREWLDSSEQAALDRQRLSSLQASLGIGTAWELRLGYQHEESPLDLEPGAAADYCTPQRDITVLAVGYAREGVEISLDQQWLWEKQSARRDGSGSATIASLSALARF